MSRVFAGSLFFLLASSSLQAGVVLNEGFDNISTLAGSGWTIVNNSSPVGPSSWFQGNAAVFPSQAGAPDSYIGANFLSTAATGGNISNWLITPVLSLQSDLQFVFFTRTELDSAFPDRLELRLSTNGASANVGATDTSVGDFTNLILSINPTLSVGGYPTGWTQVTANFVGVGVPATGRFAFRYNVTDTTTNGDYIGIDSVSVSTPSATPEPGTVGLFAFGLGALVMRRFRRANQLHF